MPNNYDPIYVGIPSSVTPAQLTNSSPSANTRSDGVGTIGTDLIKLFTGATTYGSRVSSIRIMPYATAAATATVATVIRFFLSTKTSGATTAADTWLIWEQAVASQSGASSTVAAYPIDIPFNRVIPPGYTLLVSQHAVQNANTGLQIVPEAGDYVSTP